MDKPTPVRLALLWHDTVITERLTHRGPVTVGEGLDNTLTLAPAAGLGDRHALLVADGPDWRLRPTAAMAGRLHLDRRDVALAEVPAPVMRDGDWAQLDLGPFALFVQVGGEVEVAPPLRPLGQLETPFLSGLATALSLHLAVLIVAFLMYDEKPTLVSLDQADRIIHVMMETAPQIEPEVQPMAEEATADLPGKRAGGEEGTVGEPDKKEPTRVPRRKGDLVNKIENIGLRGALGSRTLGGSLKSVFGDKEGFDSKLSAAMSGQDGDLHIGRGTGGLSLRGTEKGGGGVGVGGLHGMGNIDLGGGGAGVRVKSKLGKRDPVGPQVGTGTPVMAGQFCKEANVQKIVASHRNGVQYCFEKVLQSRPELQGKLTMSWRIGMEGAVVAAAVDKDELHDAEVAGCVLRNIRTWKFEAPEGGMCQIRYPFIFRNGL